MARGRAYGLVASGDHVTTDVNDGDHLDVDIEYEIRELLSHAFSSLGRVEEHERVFGVIGQSGQS